MKVVLSIKPEFVKKIFDRSKRFEYRRVLFKNKKVTSVVVYASSPIQKVIGEFEIEEIFHADIDDLWSKTQKYSGISKDFFYDYFSNKEKGFAIKIKNEFKYENPKCLKADFNLSPPQSFVYLK